MIVIRIAELAEQLGVHRNTIRNWINSGKLPARAVSGKRYLISEGDFSRLCQEFGLEPSGMRFRVVPLGVAAALDAAPEEDEVQGIGDRSERLQPVQQWGSVCLTCGSCASACPIAGVDGLDPRKIIRMGALGLEESLVAAQWPWKCTLCGKCEEACPMNVEIVSLLRRVRSLRERDRVPGALHKGVRMCLEKGNNMGIPKADFVALIEGLTHSMAEEEGCRDFKNPLDIQGARLLVTVNSKEPFAEPESLKTWWRIFHAAGESWTIPSDSWEGVNWALFTGDDESMRAIVGRLVESVRRLECQALLLPE